MFFINHLFLLIFWVRCSSLVMKSHSSSCISDYFSIWMLVCEMRPNNWWYSLWNKFKSSSKPTVGYSSFYRWMSKYFDLWEPWSNPKIWIFFRKSKTFCIKTPNYFTISLFKSFINSINAPLAPRNQGSKTYVYNSLIFILCFIQPIK